MHRAAARTAVVRVQLGTVGTAGLAVVVGIVAIAVFERHQSSPSYYGSEAPQLDAAKRCTPVYVAAAPFAVQIAIAHTWLRWFRFGPAEWVWRSIVYGRAQPMR